MSLLLLFQSAAEAGVSGDLAATDVADTAAFAGEVLIEGALAANDPLDVAALGGEVLVQGTLAGTDTGDTLAFAGDVLVQGDLAANDPVDSASFASSAVYVPPISSGGGVVESYARAQVTLHPIRGRMAARDTTTDGMAATGFILASGDMAANDGGGDSAAMTGTGDISTVFARYQARLMLLGM